MCHQYTHSVGGVSLDGGVCHWVEGCVTGWRGVSLVDRTPATSLVPRPALRAGPGNEAN